jgi:hypothetical protein
MDPYDTDYASSGYETDSTSLASAVNDYVFENGIYLLLAQSYHSRRLISNFATLKDVDIIRTMEWTRICYPPTKYDRPLEHEALWHPADHHGI